MHWLGAVFIVHSKGSSMAQWLGASVERDRTWALSFTSCLTLGKLFNPICNIILICKMMIILLPTSQGYLGLCKCKVLMSCARHILHGVRVGGYSYH